MVRTTKAMKKMPVFAKRTIEEREEDLIEISRMYSRGDSQQAITDQLNAMRPNYDLSRQTIRKDIILLHARWIESQLVDFDTAKAKELIKIDKLENEYWFAWNKSLQMSEEIYSEKIEDKLAGGKTTGYSREKVKKKQVTTYGDPRYLQGVQWCIDKRCKIFGLDAPKQVDIKWRDEAKMAGIDPDKIESDLVEEFVQAARDGKTMLIIDKELEEEGDSTEEHE